MNTFFESQPISKDISSLSSDMQARINASGTIDFVIEVQGSGFSSAPSEGVKYVLFALPVLIILMMLLLPSDLQIFMFWVLIFAIIIVFPSALLSNVYSRVIEKDTYWIGSAKNLIFLRNGNATFYDWERFTGGMYSDTIMTNRGLTLEMRTDYRNDQNVAMNTALANIFHFPSSKKNEFEMLGGDVQISPSGDLISTSEENIFDKIKKHFQITVPESKYASGEYVPNSVTIRDIPDMITIARICSERIAEHDPTPSTHQEIPSIETPICVYNENSSRTIPREVQDLIGGEKIDFFIEAAPIVISKNTRYACIVIGITFITSTMSNIMEFNTITTICIALLVICGISVTMYYQFFLRQGGCIVATATRVIRLHSQDIGRYHYARLQIDHWESCSDEYTMDEHTGALTIYMRTGRMSSSKNQRSRFIRNHIFISSTQHISDIETICRERIRENRNISG